LYTCSSKLVRGYFTIICTETNELELHNARHRTVKQCIIVTDHSYHGNTIALAELTTGLQVSEPRGQHIRTIHIPDLDETGDQSSEQRLSAALEEVDQAIASLHEAGFGVSALLIDPIFSTVSMTAMN